MTDPVSRASGPKATPRTATTPAAKASGGFAAAMARQSAAAGKAKAKAKPEAPKGERTQAVAGHKYAEIVAGPRNGLFLNTSGNARSGETFLIVKRAGRVFHVYGDGPDRHVYEMPAQHATKAATPVTPAAPSPNTPTPTP